MDTEEQLRSASDEVMGAIDKLGALESEKRSLAPTNHRFHKLAREVERTADRLAETAQIQADLGEQLAEEHEAAGREGASINDIEPDVNAILAQWRDAERRMEASAPGSAAESAAREEAERLRSQYQQAQANATERDKRSR